jgi:predicted phage-related endonuclease
MNAPDRAAWLAERRSGIGGSDIAALLTDPKVQQQMALAWRGLAEVHRAEDGVTVVFKE